MAGKPRRKAGKSAGKQDADAEKPRAGNTEEERVLQARKEFEEALVRSRGRGKRRATALDGLTDADDPAALDAQATSLRQRMEDAAQADQEAIDAGRPALAKHRMLPEVLAALARRSMHDILLDAGILAALRMWLEPLPDRTLPAAPFRRSILEALRDLPIETDHLRDSGIGRIVLYFSRREKELPEIQRIAKDLVFEWAQPIIGQREPAAHARREDEEDVEEAEEAPQVMQSEAYRRMQHRSPTKSAPAAARVLAKRARR